jgi:hypothetical protein
VLETEFHLGYDIQFIYNYLFFSFLSYSLNSEAEDVLEVDKIDYVSVSYISKVESNLPSIFSKIIV